MRMNELLIGGCIALWAATGFAQTRPSNPMQGMTRFAGMVEKVDGKEFLVEGRGGTTETYRLADSARITTSRPGTAADLAAGKFVGCTAVQAGDGTLHATECHIFPESMRGAGEGHNPMGPPNTTMTNGNIATMTNGNVQQATGGASGKVLRITYHGGEQRIEVSPQTHITVISAGTSSLIKAGAKVMGAVRKTSDGTELVQMVSVVP